MPDSSAQGSLHSFALYTVGGSAATTNCSFTAVVSPAVTEVITPPGPKVQTHAKGDQNAGDIGVAIQLNRGQCTRAAGEVGTSGNTFRFGPFN
jgi:hypothetical protein